jgi:hypothetical protein
VSSAAACRKPLLHFDLISSGVSTQFMTALEVPPCNGGGRVIAGRQPHLRIGTLKEAICRSCTPMRVLIQPGSTGIAQCFGPVTCYREGEHDIPQLGVRVGLPAAPRSALKLEVVQVQPACHSRPDVR